MSPIKRPRKPISHPSMNPRAGKGVARHWKGHRKGFVNQQEPGQIAFQRTTIRSLPDNVLLDIFDFYQEMTDLEWHTLVQVYRRWRYLVFASPRRLGLQFRCGATTPVREVLDVWPPMQIIIYDLQQPTRLGGDNIIAALEHPDRVCDIRLSYLTSSLLERLATVMQEPFPVLTSLHLRYYDQTSPVLPDTFLGGSAPRLQSLLLFDIPFPALPKLLLSARDLVRLRLLKVPHTGYISPEAMATCLSALTNLQSLILEFQFPSSCPDRGSQRPLLLPRVDLPALNELVFQGVSEYLEDLLLRINTPVITTTTITFFNRVIFDIPQLSRFVSHTQALGSVKRAELSLDEDEGFVRLSVHRPDSSQGRDYDDVGFPNVGVRCDAFDWKISFLVQICSQLFPLLSSVDRLDIELDGINLSGLQDDVDHTQWLEIFRPFIAVQSLHIHGPGKLIALALQELTGARVMEVLPALRRLFLTGRDLSGSVLQTIGPFITARQLSNQPVTVHQWERVPDIDDDDDDEER